MNQLERISEGLFSIKTNELKFHKITQNVATLVGWKSPEDAIDKTDYDLPSKIADLADQFVQLDRSILAREKKLVSLEAYCYNSGWKVLLCERNPFKIGPDAFISCNVIELTNSFLLKNFFLLSESDKKITYESRRYILSDDYFPFDLTERQKTCLSLLVRGKTVKQIAANFKFIEENNRRTHCDSKEKIELFF